MYQLIKTALFLILLLFIWQVAYAKQEKDYQAEWCSLQNGVTEFHLPDSTRVDCLLPRYAVEVEYAHKWAEAIGQSLYYATCTNRKPGILLIMGEGDDKFKTRLDVIAKKYKIKIWTIPK